ncbi:Rib/alpha-like domain-containing protein, partial [Lonepinella sp. BR2357]|uniref:Rib/alpha-like domain-containing protein n=1 Tax=Lonepinella sp. BR2357 TaxID=3434549 RepID=UPI003F6DBA49
MSVLLKIKTNNDVQTVDIPKNVKNQAIKIQHVGSQAVYELLDQETNLAPQQISTARVGNDLHITFQDSADEDLIIANYYDDPAVIMGLAENGQYYAYIPADGEAANAIAALKDSMLASEVLGGDAIVAGWIPTWGWVAAGVAAAGIIAAIAGHDSGSDSTANKTDADNYNLIKPDHAVPVENPSQLNDAEKAAVKAAIKAANPNLPADAVINVADNGAVTVTYKDGSTDTLPASVTVAQSTAAVTAENDISAENAVPVYNTDKPTAKDLATIKAAVEAANPAAVKAGGEVTVSPDGKTATITYPDGTTDEVTIALKPNTATATADNDITDAVGVYNPAAPTAEDLATIKAAVEAANPDAVKAGGKVTVSPDGKTATITYPDGSTDEVTVALKPNTAGATADNDITDAVGVYNPAAPTAEDLATIKAAVEKANPDAVAAKGEITVSPDGKTATITYPDGSVDTVNVALKQNTAAATE